jgi:hypothetical protein
MCVPAGTLDGTNKIFTLPVLSPRVLLLFRNGQLLLNGSSNDFTYSGSQITFTNAPISGDVLQAIAGW